MRKGSYRKVIFDLECDGCGGRARWEVIEQGEKVGDFCGDCYWQRQYDKRKEVK